MRLNDAETARKSPFLRHRQVAIGFWSSFGKQTIPRKRGIGCGRLTTPFRRGTDTVSGHPGLIGKSGPHKKLRRRANAAHLPYKNRMSLLSRKTTGDTSETHDSKVVKKVTEASEVGGAQEHREDGQKSLPGECIRRAKK